MRKTNKRGVIKNMLIGLGIFIGVIIIIILSYSRTSISQERPIGTSQTAILMAAHKADAAIMYVDEAARQAAIETTNRFLQEGPITKDYEDNTYPCGEFYGHPFWNDKDSMCTGDLSSELGEALLRTLSRYLLAHTTLQIPTSYHLIVEEKEESTQYVGISDYNLLVGFIGGGKAGFQEQKQVLFHPDYTRAQVNKRLSSIDRAPFTADRIIIHYTEGASAQSSIDHLERVGNSYHYIIGRDGTVYQTVPESMGANHVRCDMCSTQREMNRRSIGISFANCGYNEETCLPRGNACVEHGDSCWEEYTQEQLSSFVDLVADIAMRNAELTSQGRLRDEFMLGHSEVQSDKADPGPLFEEQKDELVMRINQRLLGGSSEVIASQGSQGNLITGSAIATRVPSETVQNRIALYDDIIEAEARKNELDPAIIKAIITQESAGQANIEGAGNDLGMMQIVPFTAAGRMNNHDFCVKTCGFTPAESMSEVNKDEYFDAAKNICCGAAFFKTQTQSSSVHFQCQDVQRTYTMPYEIGLRRYNGLGCLPSTKNYVEEVMEKYYFYGGNPSQMGVLTDGQFQGSYRIPLSFNVTMPIGLGQKQEVIDLATLIHKNCYEQPLACIEEHFETYNHADNVMNMSLNCSQDAVAYSFISQYAACQNTEESQTCIIELRDQTDETFTLFFDTEGIWYVSGVNQHILYNEHSVNRYTTRHGQTRQDVFWIRFYQQDGVGLLDTHYAGKLESLDLPLRQDSANFVLKKTAQGLNFYVDEREAQGSRAIQTDFLLCEKNEEATGMIFALRLEDRKPPEPFFSLSYDDSAQEFAIRIEAVLSYEDEKEVTDLKGFEVYCSDSAFETVEERLLSHSLQKRGDEAAFEAQQPYTALISKCSQQDVQGMQTLHVAVAAVDEAGQRTRTDTVNISRSASGGHSFDIERLPQGFEWLTH